MNYDDLDYMQKLAFDYGYQSEMEKVSGLGAARRAVKGYWGALSGKTLERATKARDWASYRDPGNWKRNSKLTRLRDRAAASQESARYNTLLGGMGVAAVNEHMNRNKSGGTTT